jgi:vancomycin resistance protein YoaR
MVGSASQSVSRDAPKRLGWPQWAAIIAGGALLTLFAIATIVTLVQRRMYDHRVLPGVEVDGVASSGRHEVTVYDGVARLGVRLAQSPLRVRIGSRELSSDPSLLALTIDARATADAAMNAGRDGNPFSQLFGTALRWVRPDHVQLRAVYDKNRLEGLLDGWEAETDDGKVEGGLRFEGTKVVEIEPHAGTGIIRDQARTALTHMLSGAERPVLTLPVGTLRPRLDIAAVHVAAARARRLLAHDTTLVIGTTSVVVKPLQLATALGTRIVAHHLDVTIDGARLHSAIAAALAPLESPPVDASFVVTAQNTVNVVPSRNGRQIDMDAVGDAILQGRRRIDAPLRDVTPHRNTKWAEALGIKRQVSSFTTDYPAGETRVTNIHRGADLLNNTVVEPGQVFSLNQTVGPRTAARGFVSAPVFAQGEFFDDYGGGVSQLATTTYNAAFFAGFQDVTHQPHTIYISRYPAGREATVNYGVIDLRFRDDSPHGVLIRTYYSSTSVTVALYGDTGGRTAHEENHTESNPVAVTDQTFQCPAAPAVDPHDVCATLAPGERDQISTGDAGFDVALDRVIDQPGQPSRREHYTWHYTMLPNQFVVGTAPGAETTVPASTTGLSTAPTTTSGTPRTTPPTSTNAGH